MQSQLHRTTPTLTLVVVDGIDKNRQMLHGEYKGQQVNSPAICQIGVLANAAGHMIARATETHLV